MINSPNLILPEKLVIVAVLSGGLTIGLSLISIALGIFYFAYRYNCEAGSVASSTGADYFWQTIFRVYVISDQCPEQQIEVEKLVSEHTVMILVSASLAVYFLCLVSSITLITVVQDKGRPRYINWVVFTYCSCWLLALASDITIASFFGVDYSYLTSLLRKLTAGALSSYTVEVIRQGAFWLMTIALKGYIGHIINCVLLILIVVYLCKYQQSIKNEEHPIHKLGVLNAYDSRRKPEENMSQSDVYTNSPFTRPNIMNSDFIEDFAPPRNPWRTEQPRSDYNNRAFDRSDSWHHSQHNVAPSSRPFSYLEDINRGSPSKSATKSPSPLPVNDSPWQRDRWSHRTQPHPPVPAPDYSPSQPRRLKSALKP